MANLRDCLQSALDGGEVDQTRAEAALAEFDQLSENYMAGPSGLPKAAAEAAAAADIAIATRRAATSRRHTVLAQLTTMRRNQAEMDNAADPGGRMVQIVEDIRFERDGLVRQTNGQIGAFLTQHSKSLIGRPRQRARLKNVVRALHGEKIDDPRAEGFAKAIQGEQSRMRKLFNAHGGDIGEIADFGMPHSHNTLKIREAGYDRWRNAIYDNLAWDRIEDTSTGRPFAEAGGRPDPAAADRFLRRIHERITTRGWSDRAPSMAVSGKSLANRRAEPRVMHFQNADAWMAYNDAFGDANPFDAVIGHLHGMARDVALMRVLGPNHRLGLEHMKQVAQQKAAVALDNKAENRVTKKSVLASTMLSHLDGSGSAPADHAWAAFFAGTRNLLTAAQLGSAALSSVTDFWTMRMAAGSVGMNKSGLFSRSIGLMASNSTRETALAMGYVADTLADAGNASARMLGDVWSPELTSNVANFVLRASGLSFLTDINRMAFQMEFSAFLAQNRALKFDDLPVELRGTMERSQITADDWDKLRGESVVFTAKNGAEFISPRHWLEAQTTLSRAEAEGLSIRVQSMFEREMEFAVPSVSLEGRSAVVGEAPPGTISGDLIRSVAMYKNFSVSLTLNQYRRTAAKPTGLSRATYIASLIGGLTVLGGVAVQLKEISKGRDPRPMDDPKFWGAAFFQGGGLGILGDFISSETSRSGGGLAETIGGPVVGVAGDVIRAGASNAARVADGKDPLLGRDVANLARRYTPGTSLWYSRLAMDRLVWDQLQDFLDPEAQKQWRRQIKRTRRERQNDFFWKPGRVSPRRMPDFANIGG